MSRGTVLLAMFGLLGLASGTAFLWRRSAGAAAPPPPAAQAAAASSATPITSALDPTWCGRPLGPNNPGELGDASACGKLSLTGSAPGCLFWAECREARFEIDCAAAGPGRCRCDGADGLTVPYDPAFCALDATHPQRSLRAILDAAALACRWTAR